MRYFASSNRLNEEERKQRDEEVARAIEILSEADNFILVAFGQCLEEEPRTEPYSAYLTQFLTPEDYPTAAGLSSIVTRFLSAIEGGPTLALIAVMRWIMDSISNALMSLINEDSDHDGGNGSTTTH